MYFRSFTFVLNILVAVAAGSALAEEVNLAPPAPFPTSITYYSTPGELLGKGETHIYTPADGLFQVNNTTPSHVEIFFNFPNNPYWIAEFRGPDNQPLAVGLYERAMRAPFATAGRPGLYFTGNHLGWNTLDGEFRIHQIEFNPNGSLAHFAADFVQRGDGLPQPLYGRVRYNATVPEPATALLLFCLPATFVIRRRRPWR